jgi:trimethylamine:corrinoid methyltransferase-like protein
MGIDNIMDAKVQAGRKAERAAKNASKALPADKSMHQIYSQYLAENKKDWQPGQLEATNALTCIGIQVRQAWLLTTWQQAAARVLCVVGGKCRHSSRITL